MTLLANGSIKCDECGRFIAMADIINGHAYHQFELPDSEFSVESFSSACRKCVRLLLIERVDEERSRIEQTFL